MANQSDDVGDVLVQASLTQVAAISAAVGFWSAWAESAATYSRGVADELAKLTTEGTGSGEVIGRLTDLNREYLRKLTELPTVAVERFNEEMEKIEKQRRPAAAPRRRAANAKA
jgi:hypothetical protein